MRLAHQFALESDLITADMVEATEFPHLAQRYAVRAVPRTIINETGVIEGACPRKRSPMPSAPRRRKVDPRWDKSESRCVTWDNPRDSNRVSPALIVA